MRGTAASVLGRALGWTLTVVGVVLFPLPGPGLLVLAAGLAVLARYYEWAERRVDWVRLRAIRGAAAGVQTRLRAGWTLLVTIALTASGVLWLVVPPAPEWWVLPSWLWFPGGVWAAVGQVVSGIATVALVAWSYRQYHGRPDRLALLDDELNRGRQVRGPT